MPIPVLSPLNKLIDKATDKLIDSKGLGLIGAFNFGGVSDKNLGIGTSLALFAAPVKYFGLAVGNALLAPVRLISAPFHPLITQGGRAAQGLPINGANASVSYLDGMANTAKQAGRDAFDALKNTGKFFATTGAAVVTVPKAAIGLAIGSGVVAAGATAAVGSALVGGVGGYFAGWGRSALKSAVQIDTTTSAMDNLPSGMQPATQGLRQRTFSPGGAIWGGLVKGPTYAGLRGLVNGAFSPFKAFIQAPSGKGFAAWADAWTNNIISVPFNIKRTAADLQDRTVTVVAPDGTRTTRDYTKDQQMRDHLVGKAGKVWGGGMGQVTAFDNAIAQRDRAAAVAAQSGREIQELRREVSELRRDLKEQAQAQAQAAPVVAPLPAGGAPVNLVAPANQPVPGAGVVPKIAALSRSALPVDLGRNPTPPASPRAAAPVVDQAAQLAEVKRLAKAANEAYVKALDHEKTLPDGLEEGINDSARVVYEDKYQKPFDAAVSKLVNKGQAPKLLSDLDTELETAASTVTTLRDALDQSLIDLITSDAEKKAVDAAAAKLAPAEQQKYKKFTEAYETIYAPAEKAFNDRVADVRAGMAPKAAPAPAPAPAAVSPEMAARRKAWAALSPAVRGAHKTAENATAGEAEVAYKALKGILDDKGEHEKYAAFRNAYLAELGSVLNDNKKFTAAVVGAYQAERTGAREDDAALKQAALKLSADDKKLFDEYKPLAQVRDRLKEVDKALAAPARPATPAGSVPDVAAPKGVPSAEDLAKKATSGAAAKSGSGSGSKIRDILTTGPIGAIRRAVASKDKTKPENVNNNKGGSDLAVGA